MTNREVIAVVKEGLKKVNADATYSNKGIWLKIKAMCDALIKKDADSKAAYFKLTNIYTTVLVDTIEVNPLDDSCLAGLPLDCTVCRSKTQLPKFVETAYGMLYKTITSIDGSQEFTLVTQSDYRNKSKIKYNTAKYAWIENRYMYFSHCYPCLKVIGYFEDPSGGGDGGCSFLDQQFPCTDYLLTYAIEQAINSLANLDRMPADNLANKNTNPQIA